MAPQNCLYKEPSPALILVASVTETDSFTCARDRHLFGPGPKRVLALDGGGVRGAITVAFLERIETLLSQHHGKEVRLGDWFDLVGGTSTGALIAGALALRLSHRRCAGLLHSSRGNGFQTAVLADSGVSGEI